MMVMIYISDDRVGDGMSRRETGVWIPSGIFGIIPATALVNSDHELLAELFGTCGLGP